ncbi:hypothetical protein KR074_006808, partial [Drosophila pseudoananassae]
YPFLNTMKPVEDDSQNERRSYAHEKVLMYSNNVLIGNWYNNRFQGPVYTGSTILPGLMTEKGCEHHQSCTQASFTTFNYTQSVHDHLVTRNRMFGNKVSQTGGLKLYDAEQYLNNYTSMNTLMYDLFPRLRQEQSAKMKESGQLDHSPVRLDGLDSYGNYSIVHNKLRCKLAKEQPPRGITSYKGDFVAKKPARNDTEDVGEWTFADEATKKKDREKFIFLNCNMHEDLKS